MWNKNYWVSLIYKTYTNCSLELNVNVQSSVERPELYILARCRSNDDQLMYSGIRLEDLQDLNVPVHHKEIPIEDKLRFFKGNQLSFSMLQFCTLNRNKFINEV